MFALVLSVFVVVGVGGVIDGNGDGIWWQVLAVAFRRHWAGSGWASLGGGRLTIRGGRSFLKIHFSIESGPKMIQFKIQFKAKSETFIQKKFFRESRIFNRIIHSQKMRKIIQNSKIRQKYGFGALLSPLYR